MLSLHVITQRISSNRGKEQNRYSGASMCAQVLTLFYIQHALVKQYRIIGKSAQLLSGAMRSTLELEHNCFFKIKMGIYKSRHRWVLGYSRAQGIRSLSATHIIIQYLIQGVKSERHIGLIVAHLRCCDQNTGESMISVYSNNGGWTQHVLYVFYIVNTKNLTLQKHAPYILTVDSLIILYVKICHVQYRCWQRTFTRKINSIVLGVLVIH